MKRKFYFVCLVLLASIFVCSCGGKKSTEKKSDAVVQSDTVHVYGVKSGYYKTDMPSVKSVTETWFDDWGNLQYVEIHTEKDPYVSCKLVRYNEEFLYSTYSKKGIFRVVEYLDYRTWENPSVEEMAAQGLTKLSTQIILGRACNTFHMKGIMPSTLSLWKGFIMKNVSDAGGIISEIVEFREQSVSSTFFDIPDEISFDLESQEEAPLY